MDKKLRKESPDLARGTDAEFAALFAQLDRPSDSVAVDSGYAELMSRLASPSYRFKHRRN